MSDTHLTPAGAEDGRWNNILRRSVSGELVQAAVGDVAAAGHDRVIVLGDVSDLGAADAVRTVLDAASAAGLQPWAVPGNHDVSSDPDTVTQAVAGCAGSVAIRHEQLGGPGQILVCGPGLRSQDGGQTCHATGLPDVRAVIGRFRGPVLVLHGHLHTSVTGQDGPVLQIGVPAIVEWPHAWTEVCIELTRDEVTVTTTLIPVSGDWSSADVNTVLDGPEQHWVSDGSGWRRA
jgi:3',5'-cyclic AMP phosphodiesterase CpdA